MTTREYLRQLSRRGARIEAMRERQRRYRELAQGSAAHLCNVPGGGQRQVSSVEEYAVRMIDLEREMDRRIDEYAALTLKIETAIDRIEDGRLRDLLRWRYMNEWDWEKIAQALGYERRQTFRLHGKALEAFERANAEGGAGESRPA